MRRVWGFAILLPVSLALLAAIVGVVGYEETLRQIRRVGAGAFLAVGALTLLFVCVQSFAWRLLSRSIGHRVPFATMLRAVVVGQAGNMITPSTYLGGEPLRVAYVGKLAGLPYHEVAGTVLLSKYLEFLSFMLMFGFSTAVAAIEYKAVLFRPPNTLGGVAIVAVAALMLACSVLLWASLARRWRPLTRLVRGLAWFRWLRRPVARLRHRAKAMEDQVSRTFCEEGHTSLAAFAAMLVSHLAVFSKPLVFFLFGARMRLSLGDLCLIFAAGQLILAVQLTPSGVGMLDGGLIGVFALLGYGTAGDVAMVMAYLLCLRLWDAVVIGSGAVLAAKAGARFFTSKPPPLVPDEPNGS